MTCMPTASVCIITYNHEQYIEQAVRSVLEQKTDFNVEIVIGEDGSTDRTAEVLRTMFQAESKVRLELAVQNQGMMRNLANTYANCRGEYIAFLEGDDYWTDPFKLQRQVDYLNSHRECCGCFHPAELVSADNVSLGKQRPEFFRELTTFQELCQANFIQICSVVIRKSVFPEVPKWMLGFGLADWPIFLMAATHGPFGMLRKPMSAYRVHTGGVWTSSTRQKQTEAMWSGLMRVAAKLPDEFQEEMLDAIEKNFFGEMASYRQQLEDLQKSTSLKVGQSLVVPIAKAMSRLQAIARWLSPKNDS
jgi:glycosyltransferase involved in cell wall biosynthesis